MTVTPLAPSAIGAACRPSRRLAFGAGKKGLLWLAAGLLLTLPAWAEPRWLWALAAADVLWVAAWLLDFARLPPPARIIVTRTWDGPLGLGVPSVVSLTVENAAAVDVVVTIRDTPPDALSGDQPPLSARVGARDAATVSYGIVPTDRGRHGVGIAVVRYEGPWGLAARWAIAPIAQTVSVYPDLREARRLALSVIRTSQLDLERRRARHRGASREFESLRDFRDGDELRDVCWTATARRGALVTKVYQPERSQAVWLIVDAGRLTRARVAGHRKLDHAANAAVALAHVAMLRGDRVGLLAYGRSIQERLLPGRGTAHLRGLVGALADVKDEPVEGQHLAAASEVMARQSRRALVVWLTEMAETADLPDVIEGSHHLARRHVVLLAAPRALEISARAAETPVSAEAMYRVMAAQQTAERREALFHSLRERGVLALEWTPGRLSGMLVDRYVQIKERNLV